MKDSITVVGLDVHKNSIQIVTADTDGAMEVRHFGRIGGTMDALDRAVRKLVSRGSTLRFVYEAGPCGYVICRHLVKRGFQCIVVSPSLVPKKASDRVKTDQRDAENLARLFRAGELTAIYIPGEEDEAIRDLVRARDRTVRDQRVARQRIKGMLLRLGHRYTGKTGWTDAHLRYLASIKLSHAAQQIALQEYIEAVTVASERLARLTKAVEAALPGWKCEKVVRALMSLRGVAIINAMTLVAEAGDLTRFDSPTQLMSYFGLTPSEHTSGAKRYQGGITKAGNGACRRALIEAAHHYRIAPRVSPAMQKRQESQCREVRAIALAAQQRLHSRHKVLSAHRKKAVVVVTALARELCGFVWAIACQVSAPQKLKTRPIPAPPIKNGGRVYQLDPEKKLSRP
jgi:transposase